MTADPFALSLPDAALRYSVELGWNVFRLTPGDKHPLSGSRGVHDATSHPEQVASCWDDLPDANIGVACGAPSGIFVLDVDGEEGERALAALGAADVLTVEQRTRKGRHLFFRAPASPVRNSASRLGPKLDVRGDGGYVVLAPSVHPSGARYTWTHDPFTTDIAEAPDTLLRALADLETIAPSPPAPADYRPIVGSDDRLARAEAYVAKVQDAPEGQRNATCYRVAAALVRDFALGEVDALDLLATYNATRCFPPLGVRELRSCLQSAIRHGKRAEGAAFLVDRAMPARRERRREIVRPKRFNGTIRRPR